MKQQWLSFFWFLNLPSVSAVRKTRLTWVNGIAHNLQHMDEGKRIISSHFGGKTVEFCHNPTAMSHEEDVVGYIGDLTQAGTQKLGRITAEVNELVRHLKDAVAAVGRHGRVIHIAHSQGALVTYLASRQLTPPEMSRIEVIAFGGAAALRKTPETPFYRCMNYYSVNDPLLFLVPSAVHALRSGFVGDEFCFLSPRVGDPIGDHNLLGATYGTALAWEGKRFQTQYQSLAYRVTRSLWLALFAVLQAIVHRFAYFIQKLWEPVSTSFQQLLLVIGLIWEWCLHELLSLAGRDRYEPVQNIQMPD